jgi:kinesin family protein 2/24
MAESEGGEGRKGSWISRQMSRVQRPTSAGGGSPNQGKAALRKKNSAGRQSEMGRQGSANRMKSPKSGSQSNLVNGAKSPRKAPDAASAAAEEAEMRASEVLKIRDSKGDIKLLQMIQNFRGASKPPAHVDFDSHQHDLDSITVCVRKRPLSRKEQADAKACVDVVTCQVWSPVQQKAILHAPKTSVDGTRKIDNNEFSFSEVFDEFQNNTQVYERAVQHLVPFIFDNGYATCFAYGQTGSGKTFTMAGEPSIGLTGINQAVIKDVYRLLNRRQQRPTPNQAPVCVCVSYFEIYGGNAFDLLNGKKRLKLMENARRKVEVVGLVEQGPLEEEDVLAYLNQGDAQRSSGATGMNEQSSRSHAIFQIILRDATNAHGGVSQQQVSEYNQYNLALQTR